MEKAVLDRRLEQLEAEGVEFRCRVSVGEPAPDVAGAAAPDVTVVSAGSLQAEFDALVLAGGATLPRDLPVPGRELAGIHRAMDFLKPSNLVREGLLAESPISAEGKHVVIIGGGDTGADCLGTVHRQRALSVHQLEIMPEPPPTRTGDNPWPTWPTILRTSSALEEGGERLFSVTTAEFVDDGNGHVRALRGAEVEMAYTDDGRPEFVPVEGSEFELRCELVLLAMGFLGTERNGVVAELGLEVNGRGSVVADASWSTNVEGVFVCGDMTRGQSLIVWAIAEGRSAAAAVDRYLMGTSALPAPIVPGQLALR
jgi:glutamate synthase (NADPH/NADH) small chain